MTSALVRPPSYFNYRYYSITPTFSVPLAFYSVTNVCPESPSIFPGLPVECNDQTFLWMPFAC